MKGLSPSKLKSIIALNFAAIALLIGLLFYQPWQQSSVSGSPDEYERIRAANISLNPALSWELMLLGDGVDTTVDAFVYKENLFVFGNTTSSSLDFDRAGIFLAIVGIHGVTNNFFIYGGEGDILRSVCQCEGGFLLAIEGKDWPKLFLVDFSGTVRQVIDGFIPSFEKVVKVKYYSYGYLLFTQPSNTLTGVGSLRCLFFSPTLSFISSSIAVSPYSLNYFESAVISNKVVVFCNASSSMHTFPAIATFSQNESANVLVHENYPGAIKGLSIYNGQFLLLTNMEGSSLLHINLKFEIVERIFLSQLEAHSLCQTFSDDQQLYLAFLDTVVFVVSAKGERKSTLPQLIPQSYAFVGESVVYSGQGGLVNIYHGDKAIFSANIGFGSNSLIALDNHNIFCILSYEDNVYIIKLRYPLFYS